MHTEFGLGMYLDSISRLMVKIKGQGRQVKEYNFATEYVYRRM